MLLYAGDVDYICNWLGNKKWALDLEWDGKTDFVAAEDKPWMLSTGENMGRIRTHENFKFLQVYNAGHMVPMDQPQAASEMLNSWLDGSLGINCSWHQKTKHQLTNSRIYVKCCNINMSFKPFETKKTGLKWFLK